MFQICQKVKRGFCIGLAGLTPSLIQVRCKTFGVLNRLDNRKERKEHKEILHPSDFQLRESNWGLGRPRPDFGKVSPLQAPDRVQQIDSSRLAGLANGYSPFTNLALFEQPGSASPR